MTAPPESLALLLAAPPASRDSAWAAFLAEYSDLIRFAIRKTEHDPDAVGDAYAYVLEHLRRDDFRRLRAFDVDGRAKFSTWLVVVVRRLVIDLRRKRSGRNAPAEEPGTPDPRRRLEELASAVSDITRIPDSDALDPAELAEVRERLAHLRAAVEGLPTRDRLLLALRFEDGLSARAIAETLSFDSQFHVYRRLKSVLAELREALQAAGIDSGRG